MEILFLIVSRHATIVCDLNIHQRLFSQRFRRDKQFTIFTGRPRFEML